MTEAGIDSGFTRDLFVALGEQLNNGDWSLRIYVKPFVSWIWLGSFIMALGGMLSISDKRYRTAKIKEKAKLKAKPTRPSVLIEQPS
jgi:cytochrome c-type biogenesis protein CcmF